MNGAFIHRPFFLIYTIFPCTNFVTVGKPFIRPAIFANGRIQGSTVCQLLWKMIQQVLLTLPGIMSLHFAVFLKVLESMMTIILLLFIRSVARMRQLTNAHIRHLLASRIWTKFTQPQYPSQWGYCVCALSARRKSISRRRDTKSPKNKYVITCTLLFALKMASTHDPSYLNEPGASSVFASGPRYCAVQGCLANPAFCQIELFRGSLEGPQVSFGPKNPSPSAQKVLLSPQTCVVFNTVD